MIPLVKCSPPNMDCPIPKDISWNGSAARSCLDSSDSRCRDRLERFSRRFRLFSLFRCVMVNELLSEEVKSYISTQTESGLRSVGCVFLSKAMLVLLIV